jgi:polysaccharide deacetylase 2 family uncharacterized protein YibQ
MSQMVIRVVLNVDLDAFRAQYAQPGLTADDIRDHITTDIREALSAAPYTDGLNGIDVGQE